MYIIDPIENTLFVLFQGVVTSMMGCYGLLWMLLYLMKIHLKTFRKCLHYHTVLFDTVLTNEILYFTILKECESHRD